MGYKELKNSPGVEKGYVKYQFYLRFKGERYRRMEICRRSAVDAIYRDWEGKIISQSIGRRQYKFFQIMDEYLEYVKKTRSVTQYKSDSGAVRRFKMFFKKNLLLSEFRRGMVDDYICWRKTKVFSQWDNSRAKGSVANSTVNRDIAVLSSMFNYCIRREYIMHNPATLCKLKENNQRNITLADSQIKELLLKAADVDRRLYNIVALALMTGMRKKEILTLEWSEVHLDASMILLSAHKTKSRKSRVIPVTQTVREILLSMYNNGNRGLVVGDYTDNILRKQWAKLLELIDFNKLADGSSFNFHLLRHVFATTLLNKGVGLEDIQSLLGHESITTTQERYAHYARQDLLEKVSKLDNVVRLNRKVI